ncbi:MAG: hypothetical protein J6A59_17165, partial [Lachnospiraceae bacterium]|nr:hypothetical protein [Lachnospiraceae bacterium]
SGYYSGDMNNLTTTGRYWCTNCDNMPTANNWGVCEVTKPVADDSALLQTVYDQNAIYTRFYVNDGWLGWITTDSKPTRIGTQTTIEPTQSAAFKYDATKTYSLCEIMFYGYGGFRQSIKIPLVGTIIKFMTSSTEWGGSFNTSFGNGGLVITNNSGTQKLIITHIYMIP